jgi:hypothetical protein
MTAALDFGVEFCHGARASKHDVPSFQRHPFCRRVALLVLPPDRMTVKMSRGCVL